MNLAADAEGLASGEPLVCENESLREIYEDKKKDYAKWI